MRVLASLLAAAVLLLAGCMGGSTQTRIFASSGFVSNTYAYDGNGTDAAQMIRIEVDERANTGLVEAEWREGPVTYRVSWSQFAQAADKEYQDGGVVARLDAHGSTGHGDTLLPKVHYISAAWGLGQVRFGDQPFVDPTTRLDRFVMHYMLLKDAVRDPITHKIFARDGKTLYSPDQPDDALLHKNERELILTIKSAGVAVPERVNKNMSNVNTPPTALNSVVTRARMPITPDMDRLTVWVNLTSPLPTGQVIVRLKAPDGTVAKETVLNANTRGFHHVQADPALGNWTLEAVEQSPNMQYRITWHTHVPRVDPWFRMLTFEGPRVENAGRTDNATVAS